MKTAHFLRKDLTATQDLSAGALTYTTSIGRKFKLEEVILKASVDISEVVTVTRDAAAGADYDHVIAKRSLIGEQSFVFRPDGECNFQSGDNLKIECTNANLTGIVFATLKLSEM